jgi:hypothetical protein
MQLYTDDNSDIFPAHRNQNEPDNPTTARTNWWGTTILAYARAQNQTNLFCCPAIKGKRLDNGVVWNWVFDCHKVGYGINSYFLSFAPYTEGNVLVGGVTFTTHAWFKRSSIKNPAENLLIGDSMPKSDGLYSSSMWWPNACMDKSRSASQGFEGIDNLRHRNNGVVVFSDGHSEARKDATINPPVDPGSGDPRGLVNSRHWDPLKRGGDH